MCIRDRTYIVHDHHDAELLKQLFRQVGVDRFNRPNIMRFKKSDRRYDVRRPHSSVLNAGTGAVPVSELLEYSSPWVYNALINTAKLDKRVITESIESAYDVANAGRGDIIKFYNRIFIPTVKTYLLWLQKTAYEIMPSLVGSEIV